MKSALIFLNGYYDLRYPEFYKQEIARGVSNGYPVICADGGLRLFDHLNGTDGGVQFRPDILIGDFDSLRNIPVTETLEGLSVAGTHIVREWVGQVDKDYTDGQLAVAYAIEVCECQRILIYGGLPRPDGYETDHFLGNLKLTRFGLRVLSDHRDGQADISHYTAEMRDPLQTIHFVISDLHLERKNDGLQRVSLIAEHTDVRVEKSENLRWDVSGMQIDPDMSPEVPSTLRNEFAATATSVSIHLAKGSEPVYVVHNWYEAREP